MKWLARKWTLLAFLPLLLGSAPSEAPVPLADHHQHLFRAGLPRSPEGSGPFGADRLVAMLDEAGIRRAVVLSVAYQFGNPNRPAVEDEYAQVKAENDWTSGQVGLHPDRLVGFCAVNPLKDYALAELERCAADPNLRTGLKLHFGNSDVQLDLPAHAARVSEVFSAADRNGMAIVIHFRPSVSAGRPFGADEARTFISQVLPAAPHVPIQIAHLSGAGGFDDPGIDQALEVFAGAVAAEDPRVKNLYFDVSGVAGIGEWKAKGALIVRRIRQLGLSRILYGSDGAVPGNTPREAWQAFRELPLSEEEFARIAGNVAPYLR
jgi:predicted TIM-barrel fold metal-dependent hydrolase